MITVTWLIILVGVVVSAILLGVLLGNLVVKLSVPATSTSTPVTPTSTLVTSTPVPPTPTLAPPTPTLPPPTPTPTSGTPIPPIPAKTLITNKSCDKGIFIHTEPGKDKKFYDTIDGVGVRVELNETVTLIGKRKLYELNPDNPEGYWLKIYPQGKEIPGWISNEICLNLSQEVLNSLPDK